MAELDNQRIVLCFPVEDQHLQLIKAVAPACEVINAGQERIADEILAADIFCGHAKVPVPWDEVVDLGRLKWIQSSAAGLDHCLVPSVIDSPIAVSSASGLFADQVAEQALCLVLSLIRRLTTFFVAQQHRQFRRQPTDDLHGKTVGIVGLGGNGRRIAQVLSAFNVRILATDCFHDQPKPPEVACLWPAEQLHRLLRESDIVIVCVPLNRSTEKLFGPAELREMKDHAYLVNIARGQVLDEQALIDQLAADRFAGVGLDVTETEPLPAKSPLWDFSRVIITPHVGAQSSRRVEATVNFFCRNLRRFEEGQSPLNLVDKVLGFPRPEHREAAAR